MTGLSPQEALAALTKNRLRGLANALDLAAPARARKSDLIEALTRSRSFKRTLSLLSRNELKAVCRALRLDDSGREKAKIIERISLSGIPLAEETADEQREPLTLAQLESHLWESANILRGKIDSSDFKHFIFGLLFFKRLCDVWEEEYGERLARYGDPQR
ncbi:MAG: type I restriction-modification system subunit M N-terminal domain-containing protein, partial [Acidobacteriota bacterium]